MLLIAIVFSGTILSNSATFTVTKTADTNDGVCNADCSLREAITAANAVTSDDVIEFDKNVFGIARVITLTDGGFNISSNGSLTINGTNANLLSISGNNQRGIFYIGGANVTISGITIMNGNASAPGGSGVGGGINNQGGTLTINSSIIKNNFSTFEGAGIYNLGTLSINDSTISENSGREGSGIFHQVGTLTINNSTVSKNEGGGISNRGLVNINASTISNNTGRYNNGGGIITFGGTVNLSNSTVSNNFRSGVGGGIAVESRGTVNLTNSTVAFNSASAGNGGGVYCGFESTVKIRNSIIARNIGASAPSDFGGTLQSQGYNLIGSTAFTTITGDVTGNLLNIDPLLLPLGNNGGNTQTHVLRENSPAIDKGDPENVTATDQRGVSRPFGGDGNGAGRADIGAIEAGILVTNTNNNGVGSLRQAIADANATTTNDEIRFSTLFDTPQTISLTSGELVIANSGSLIINGTGADKLTISGNNQSRIFSINAGTNVSLSKIAIADGNVANGSGGGILNTGVLVIDNSIVRNNKAIQSGNGGGIYNTNDSTLTLTNSTIHNNSAIDGGGVGNGFNGTLSINNSTISQNTASADGGGINNFQGKLKVNNSSIMSNTAGEGGGIGNSSDSGIAILTNSTVSNNEALGNGGGGGISNKFGIFSLANTTISNNSATFDGGGIRTVLGVVNLVNLTVSGNSARQGGGVQSGGVLNSRSSIIANNTASHSLPDFTGTLISQGYNLIGNTSGTTIAGTITGNLLDVDPLLLPLANNGGATQTHAFQASSPAIDAGDPTDVLATDQRGFNRVTDGDANGIPRADIGAFESGSLIANTYNSGAGSLRQAVLDARAGAGDDEIRFSTLFNTPQIITLTSGELFIGGKLIISASGPNMLTISGNNQSRVFNVGEFADLTLNNLTVTSGKAVNGDGGGIINYGSLTINDSIISDNTADGGGNNPFAGGGGIFNNAGKLLLTNSSVINNKTTNFNGGGILNNTGTIEIINSAINNNTASSEGGGIGTFGGTVTVNNSGVNNNKANRSGGILNTGLFIISNSTISNNRAQLLYGGIYNGSVLNIDKSTISNNQAPSEGGGIFNLGFITMSNSTISGNTSDRGGGINNNWGTNHDRGKLSIVNSTISGNRATIQGGGIYTVGGIVSLIYSTIAFNSATTNSGGVANFNTELSSQNTIIARNVFGNGGTTSDVTGLINSQGYNLIGSTSGTTVTGITTGNKLNIDPLLDPIMRNNGGLTQTHALRQNSPAIDAAGTVANITTDQRGLPRLFDYPLISNATGGNGSDIGTFERQSVDVLVPNSPFDFDGDSRTDISIFRPLVGEWWYLKSSSGGNGAFQFGTNTDKMTPADFTGDGKSDFAFFRPSTGEWFVLRSEDSSFYSFPFGSSGDVPIPADFDGDGKADAAVFRPSTNTWYILKSTGGTTIQTFGAAGDVPVVADYDGDNKADIAIYRPSKGEWWIQRSAAGSIAFQFGSSTDKAVQADFTGDGKADVAFFRPQTGEWFVLRSENQSFYSFPFGASGDVPAPGDYDGDGKSDAAVFRPSNNTWFVQRSTSGTLIQTFGQSGDKPVPNAFVP